MTRNYRKERGRATEHLVAQAFAADGWPFAEATGAGSPGRDIKGVPGVSPEVKARTRFEPLAALRQAVANADGDVPVVIVRPNGCGPASIDDWPAFLTFGQLRRLLRAAGYGSPLNATQSAETPAGVVPDACEACGPSQTASCALCTPKPSRTHVDERLDPDRPVTTITTNGAI